MVVVVADAAMADAVTMPLDDPSLRNVDVAPVPAIVPPVMLTVVDDAADSEVDTRLTAGKFACATVRAANTLVKAVEPPELAVPDTTRNALLL